jgi:hypothetical protein
VRKTGGKPRKARSMKAKADPSANLRGGRSVNIAEADRPREATSIWTAARDPAAAYQYHPRLDVAVYGGPETGRGGQVAGTQFECALRLLKPQSYS